MKICHILWGLALGGTENMIVDIINEQVHEAEISLIVVDSGHDIDLLETIDSRVKIYLLKRKPGRKSLGAIIKLNLILLFTMPPIVHCHTPSLMKLIFLNFLSSINFCVTVHDTNIKTSLLTQYDRIFSISPTVKNDIYSRYKLTSVIVPNGIHFHKVSKRETFKTDKPFSIVQVSRLDHTKKGQKLLIEAVHDIIWNHNIKNIKITFIGDGPSMAYLKKFAATSGIGSNCFFLGSQSRASIYSSLKNYNLLVQPSYYEGFGLTVVEGIAANLPVLVSDIEGPVDIIKFGKYGYSFKKGDKKDLSEKIKYIISKYGTEAFNNKIKRSYDYAINCYDVKKTAKSYLSEYNHLSRTEKL